MAAPILATKLHIPAPRPALLTRPRLIARLNAGLAANCKLTLISAPAGFGKTTLLSEWTSQRIGESTSRQPVAWLLLNEGLLLCMTAVIVDNINAIKALENRGSGVLQNNPQ